jgi:hypothetical protein
MASVRTVSAGQKMAVAAPRNPIQPLTERVSSPSVLRRNGSEERKKLGLPPRVIGTILPHSAVPTAEERWDAEQERKKKPVKKRRKPTPKAKNSGREKGHD